MASPNKCIAETPTGPVAHIWVPHLRDGLIVANRGPRQLRWWGELRWAVSTMKVLQRALRPGAKVGIIDRNGNGANHGLKQDVVVREMADAGYKLVGTYDFTKADGQDYFLIFQVQ